MDKYSTELEDEKVKTAEIDKGKNKCPICGAELDSGRACPNHGTEPLEKRPPEKKQ